MKKRVSVFSLALCCIAALVVASCSKNKEIPVTREDLFSLNIGRMEDQIDLYDLQGARSMRKTCLAMRDGLFYISDGNGEKIVHYTSYGDLLFMIYNKDTNPPPMTLRTEPNPDAKEGAVTRWAYPYPLREPGSIAVDSRKHIYVEDMLPIDRRSYDPDTRTLLDSIVLHFDENGRFLEYLGQEGVGGTPFPRIEKIYASVNDELVVVCHLSIGWNIYWFNADGRPLYFIQLKNGETPIPQDRMPVFASVDEIAAAPDGRKLFIKVDYYRDLFDESTKTKLGTELDSSMIWIMNVETGKYIDTIEVPFYEKTIVENHRKTTEKRLYSFLGVMKDSKVFLSLPVQEGYSIMLLSPDPHDQRRGFIQVKNDELEFNTFNVSADGILSAILATDFKAKIVWWRTDKLVEGGKSR
jgi:hypothetical protein